MSEVSVTEVSVRYGDFNAVDRVSVTVPSGHRLAILGSSGSGKSSLLRGIAGLEPLSSGSVRIDGVDMAGIPTHRRGVGLMFQSHALFPHLDVAGNVSFGLRMERIPKAQRVTKVSETLELVGLADRASARVDELSGGEQQRVALARTLAPGPKVVLLDEPLGSLDRVLREDLLVTMRDVFIAAGATAVFVTHDQAEAFAVGDRVALMKAGRFHQEGTPEELWRAPRDRWSARFLGLRNVFDPGELPPAIDSLVGDSVLVRPDLLELYPRSGGPSALSRAPDLNGDPDSFWPVQLPGRVRDTAFTGAYHRISVQLDGVVGLLDVWRLGGGLPVGSEVVIGVAQAAVVPLA